VGSVQKRPDGKWRARYRDPARKEHARHFDRKLDAQRWVDAQETAKSRGEWIDPALSRITVGAWAAEWLAGQVQIKPSTRARYAGVLRVQVLPTWERVPLREVTHSDVARWVAHLVSEGLSARTVHKAHRVLSLVLDLAVRDGRLTRNPAVGVRLPRAAQGRKRFLTAAEVAALAEASGRDRVLVYVLAYCGLRFGEAAGLRVGDVDFLRRRLKVERSVSDVDGHLVLTTPKTHHAREVPMPAFVAAMLADTTHGRSADSPLFTSPVGALLRGNNFRRRSFDRAAASIGLPGLTPHELRHTAASLAVSAGANVKAVQRMLGHASAAMTLDVYAGLFGDDLDLVADRLDATARAAAADQVRTDDPDADDNQGLAGDRRGSDLG
jgi:integrase